MRRSEMGRLSNSWTVFKESVGVLKKDKELLVLPVLSGIASLIVVASFVFPAYTSGLIDRVNAGDQNAEYTGYALMLLAYLVLSFVTIYFQSALIFGANERLGGGDPTIGSALRGANSKLGKIFLWSLFAATVSLLIQALEQALRRAGNQLAASILGSILGTAWSLMTYFVIPVVLFEEKSTFASLKRSGSLFKQRWGESLVGEWGIGMFMGLITILSMVVVFLLASVIAPLGFAALVTFGVAAVLWFVLLAVVGQALGGIYRVALYRFASKGEVVPYFTPQAIEGAYHPTYTSANRL